MHDEYMLHIVSHTHWDREWYMTYVIGYEVTAANAERSDRFRELIPRVKNIYRLVRYIFGEIRRFFEFTLSIAELQVKLPYIYFHRAAFNALLP